MKQNDGDWIWPKNFARAHVLRIKLKVPIRDFKIQRRDSNENITCVLSVFIAIIPTYLLCQMYANLTEFEFQGTIFKFRKQNKISSLPVYVLHKHEIRHFHVVVVQKRQRNVQKSVT